MNEGVPNDPKLNIDQIRSNEEAIFFFAMNELSENLTRDLHSDDVVLTALRHKKPDFLTLK